MMLGVVSALLLMAAELPRLRGPVDVDGAPAADTPHLRQAHPTRPGHRHRTTRLTRHGRTPPIATTAPAPLSSAAASPSAAPVTEAPVTAAPVTTAQPLMARAAPTAKPSAIKGLDKDLAAALTGPQGPPPSAMADSAEIPPGAPDDDYGLVAWCQGALAGHMSLYMLVKPQLDEMEHAGADKAREDKDNDRIDAEQQQAGRDYLALYARARSIADKHSGGSQKPRGDQARMDGEHIWAAARLADPSTRMWSWIMWELPARCETAARRLERNEGVMGEVIRGHHADERPDHRPN